MKSSGQNTETRSGYLVFLVFRCLSWGYVLIRSPSISCSNMRPVYIKWWRHTNTNIGPRYSSNNRHTVCMYGHRYIDRSINDKFPLIQLLAIFSNPMSTLSISCVFVWVCVLCVYTKGKTDTIWSGGVCKDQHAHCRLISGWYWQCYMYSI